MKNIYNIKSLFIIVVFIIFLILLINYNVKDLPREQNIKEEINRQDPIINQNKNLDISVEYPKKENSLPSLVEFPPSQRSIDGFFIGQHINAIKNVLGEPDHSINQNEGETYYFYKIDDKGSFIAFGLYEIKSGLVGVIQLTGDYSDKETFLGLKLGDSKEKLLGIFGQPSEIVKVKDDIYFYKYNNRNYSFELNKKGILSSIRIATFEGFPKNVEIGDFVGNFKNVLNTGDLNKISEFLMPDVEIYVKDQFYKIEKRFLDALKDPNSMIKEYLLLNENSVKNILNNYNGKINMELRITDRSFSGYVYKFIDSKILEEIFVVEQAGKYRVYEIKYRDALGYLFFSNNEI